MSLEIKDINIKVAEKDIVCYKIVNKDIQSFNDIMTGKKKIFTTYYGIVFGKTYCHIYNSRHVDLKFEEFIDQYSYKKRYRVVGGYHSYRTKEWIKVPDEPGIVLVECIIPKGTKYIEDDFGMYYVSETIRIVKEL